MNRGEVWWAGAASGARRPYLILTRQSAIGFLHSLLAVPATRTIRRIPTEVPLGPEDGMPEPCVLTLDNLTLLPKDLLAERLCTLSSQRLDEVCEALSAATRC